MDPWRFEGGPAALPAFQCAPRRQESGWEFDQCSYSVGGPDSASFRAFVPVKGDSGLEVDLRYGESTFPTLVLTKVPQRDEPKASDNVKLLWQQSGARTHSDIWAADGLVFAPHYSDGDIEILDADTGIILSTASVPEVQGGSEHVLDVKARDGLLYAATAHNGLVVFDVSRPATPELVGQFFEERPPENFTNIHNIFLSPDGNFVYAINHSSLFDPSLVIVDVTDPTSPSEAGRFSIGEEVDLSIAREFKVPHDIIVMDHNGRLIAFLNYLAAGLWILDVTDPSSISVLSFIEWDRIFSHSGWPFELEDRLYYFHASEGYDRPLTILDVTDLTAPRVVSRFKTREGLSPHNVEVVDGIAYISYYIDGLRVVDLRDPENPREIGHFDTVPAREERDIIQGLWGVHVADGTVYVSDFEKGTYAFQISLEP